MRFFNFVISRLFINFHKSYLILVYRLTVLLSHQFGLGVMLGSLFTPLFGTPGILSRINGLFVRFLVLIIGGAVISVFVLLSVGLYIGIIVLPFYLIINYPLYFIGLVLLLAVYFVISYIWGIPYRIHDHNDINEYLYAGDHKLREIIRDLRYAKSESLLKFIEKSGGDVDLFLSRAEVRKDSLLSFINHNRASFRFDVFANNLMRVTSESDAKRLYIEIILTAYLLTFDDFQNFVKRFNLTQDNFIAALKFQIFLKLKDPMVWDEDYIVPPAGGIDKGWAVGYSASLNTYGTDLTKLALKGLMPKLYGRRNTRHEVTNILSKSSRNNVLLVGPSGAGKTTFVHALAREIATGTNIPELRFKRIISLNVGSILSGDKGEVNKRMTSLLEEAKSAGNIILFIDEIQSIDANVFNIVEPYLSSGKFQFIGTTSQQNYAKHIQPNDSFARTFDLVQLPETNLDETIVIMQDQVKRLEKEYQNRLIVTYPAILSSIEMAKKYVHNRAFPDKSAELINQAFARARNMQTNVLDRKSVIELIAEVMDLPIKSIDEDEKEILMNLEKLLHSRIVGQDIAVEAISNSLKRARAGVKDDSKPMGSFLFAGPTGVGKTETAKALAELYFGSAEAMIRIDMSEYQTSDSISRLIGSESGEVGQLVYKVQAKPYSLILLDEIEKAHPSVLNLFLQVLDEGHLTSAAGDKTYFSSTFIIMTSNVGTRELMQKLSENKPDLDITQTVTESLKHHFPPEFLNRFTGLVPFMPLDQAAVKDIVKLKLKGLAKKLRDAQQIEVLFSDSVVDEVAELGLSKDWGARSINRVIEDKIETSIAEKIISGDLKSGDKYLVENLNGNN